MSRRTGGVVRSNGDTRGSGGSKKYSSECSSKNDINAQKRTRKKRSNAEKRVAKKIALIFQKRIERSKKRRARFGLA